MMAETLLEAKDIEVIKGQQPILQVPQWRINGGQTLGIIGPNGAGKSTLLRVLGLIEAPTRGELYWKGEAIGTGPRDGWLGLRRKMATVFQETLLLNTTVYDNVAVGLRFRRLKEAEIRVRVNHWLERLGIAHLARRKAHTLSGGEARRVSLARAWVLDPEIIFLDEPFSDLDRSSRAGLISDLAQLIAKSRTSVVLVTHDFADLPGLVDRVLVLMGGTIRQEGRVREVLGAPTSLEVASFVGVENLIPGQVVEFAAGNPHGRMIISPATAPAIKLASTGLVDREGCFRAGTQVTLCVRSQDVALAPRKGVSNVQAGNGPSGNRVAGTIRRLIPAGGGYRAEIDCGFPLVAWISWTQRDEYGLEVEDQVWCSFSPACLHVIPASSGPASN